MTEEMYETAKTVFAENERLFTKLHRVAQEYNEIDFDESGFYEEDAQRCERHWSTLAGKIADALDGALEDAEVRLLKNKEPNICSLRFDITASGEDGESATTRLNVDYSVEGQISIERQNGSS